MTEHSMADLSAIRDGFADQMRLIAKAQQERANVTASASVERGRVTITVNANGLVIDAKFANDIDDLSYDQIAAAVVAATQQAAADAAKQSKELMDPLIEQRRKLPNVEDLVGSLGSLRTMIPVKPEVSTASPAERAQVTSEPMTFADAVEHDGSTDRGSGITESSW